MIRLLLLFISLTFFSSFVYAQSESLSIEELSILQRIQSGGELAPLPEAKPLLIELSNLIETPEFKSAIASSQTLQMLRERLKTSLYHLNLKFETVVANYPYEPPFKDPFPFRPTLETIDEATRYLETVKKVTGFDSHLTSRLQSFPYFRVLSAFLSASSPRRQQLPKAITKSDIIEMPVDSYLLMQDRLEKYGEIASFPEFATEVNDVLQALKSDEVRGFTRSDRALELQRDSAIIALEEIKSTRAAATNLQKSFRVPYPYRRTIQAIEKGLMVLDLKERIKYPETENWHEVELSWYNGGPRKLRPLYHFNRYKYQLCGLLANHEIVVLPFGAIDIPSLTRLRAVPFGLLGATTHTNRVDRFHHTPLEEWYHDANHARRMYGYDTKKWKRLKITTREQKIALYRAQDAFIRYILDETTPTNSSEIVNETRKQQRVIMFESIHETALTPDRDSLMRDLLRKPNTPQPFERQEQAVVADIESIRTFDGNLRSGADVLPLNLQVPTRVIYFYDRAPGFLTNIDNKLRWGFYDSVFNIDESLAKESYRTPEFLADSAIKFIELLGYTSPDSKQEIIKQIEDRSGQPELYNYYGLDAPERQGINKAKAPEGVTTGLRIPDNKTRNKSGAPRRLKVGIYTGSFDPPHLGHKKIVDDMKIKYGLDIVYVVPDMSLAYKPGMQPYNHRKNMIIAMFKDAKGVKVPTAEMESRFGNGEMWDVVSAVRAEHPNANLYNIMGSDTFEWYKTLPSERRAKDVMILANIRSTDVKIPTSIEGQPIRRVDLNDSGYSSTSVRAQLRSGAVPSELPTPVYDYIKEHGLYQINQTGNNPISAREIHSRNPNLKPEEVARQTLIGSNQRGLLQWMLNDLEQYYNNFNETFNAKLSRIRQHQIERLADLNQRISGLKIELARNPNDSNLLGEIARLEKELKPQAFVREYSNAEDFIQKFVGPKKVIQQPLTQEEVQAMNRAGRKFLYVDAWSVPFFNTGTQTKQEAKAGVLSAIQMLRAALSGREITAFEFTTLTAVFARPEFDDLRRFKLKMFPSESDIQRFGNERSDARFAGNFFSTEKFDFINQPIDIDPLSKTFGQRIHTIELKSHDSIRGRAVADGRVFTGPADFLEHDLFHAFLLLSNPFPGSESEWSAIHDKFFLLLNAERNAAKRQLMRLVYFHLTREAGYRTLLPDASGKPADPTHFNNLKADIIEKIDTRNYYDWVKALPELNGQPYLPILESAFNEVGRFVRDEFQRLLKSTPAMISTRRQESRFNDIDKGDAAKSCSALFAK